MLIIYLYIFKQQLCLYIFIKYLYRTKHASDFITQSEFSNWLLKVGNRTVPILNDIDNIIDLPPDIVLPSTSLQDFISIVYPNLLFLFETPELLLEHAILVPRNKHVNEINDIIIESLPTTIIHSFSADTLDPASTSFTQLNLFPVELLNSFTPSGFPPHDLKLKVGSPILLLCNINQEQGLCNGTCLICKAIHKRVLEAEFLQGLRVHTRILLPRISFSPKPGDLPFKFIRCQFPVMPAFAMSINKSQEQTLKYVGIDLREPVFSHGQLYIALSRAIDRKNISILLPSNKTDNINNQTTNIVYPEVFDY
ncbi:17144_t:CDS:2 [Cetraspora pellucida]|uniref:17144_t:CDS:1 n=1 Tax=Cetraspora pellucida TaxID=1433469 RepID=A0A9N9NFH7_9GLOM|nr:17144_t:CDS:2 [Cetraspora pellucida]